MNTAIVGDIHARGSDLGLLALQLNAAARVIRERQIEVGFIAGDVFDHSFASLRVFDGSAPLVCCDGGGDIHATAHEILGTVWDFFTASRARWYVIHGQHDQSGPSIVPAIRVLEAHPNVIVETEPTAFLFDSCSVALLPWQWHGNADDTLLELVGSNPIDLLIAHANVEGARLNGAAYAPHFAEPSSKWTWCLSARSVVGRFRHAAVGDYHGRQEVWPGVGGPLGAIRQMNFGEEGNPQGFEVWDSETNLAEWVELDAYPPHRTWRVGPGHAAPTPEELRGCIARVIYDEKPAYAEAKALADAGATLERVEEKQERIRRVEVPDNADADPRRLIRPWAASQNPSIENLDIEAMESAYNEIMESPS